MVYYQLFTDLEALIRDLLNKYPELQQQCKAPVIHHLDNPDESHIWVYQLEWNYPGSFNDEIDYVIADQSAQLFIDLKNWIANDPYGEPTPFKEIWRGSNLPQEKEGYEHIIFATGGDTLAIHCNDNTLQIIITLSGQW